MKNALSFMLTAFVLSGCGGSMPIAPQRDLITISPDMVRECPGLKRFEGKNANDLAVFTAELISEYNKCSDDNHFKVELFRKVFGVRVQQ